MSLTSRFTRPDAGIRVTRSRAIRRCGAGLMGVAMAAATLTATSAPAAAEPLIPANMLGALAIPFDAELAGAVRLLKAAGVDQIAVQAAQTIMGSAGQLSVEDIAGRAGALPLPAAEGAPAPAAEGAPAATPVAAPTDPIALLRTLGIQTLTPSVSPFCTAPTADNPLGLVTAGAGAVAGPWPMKTDPLTQLKPLLDMIPGVKLPEKLNLVDKGETAYAFVPASPTAGSGGTMQVAWFNTSTLQGGFADLDPITDRTALTALPLLSGVRLAPVKTGSGTILSAVFGNASNGTQNCWFLPAVGVVNA